MAADQPGTARLGHTNLPALSRRAASQMPMLSCTSYGRSARGFGCSATLLSALRLRLRLTRFAVSTWVATMPSMVLLQDCFRVPLERVTHRDASDWRCVYLAGRRCENGCTWDCLHHACKTASFQQQPFCCEFPKPVRAMLGITDV